MDLNANCTTNYCTDKIIKASKLKKFYINNGHTRFKISRVFLKIPAVPKSAALLLLLLLLKARIQFSTFIWGNQTRKLLLKYSINVWKRFHTLVHLNELKGRYTIGNCQRPVFSLGVSQNMHKITNLWKFQLSWNWSSKLRDNNERKNTLVKRSCVRLDGWFRDLKF